MSGRVCSLHGGAKELLTVGVAVDAAILDSLLEVLALLRYNYQGLLVLTERADLLALRRHVILFEGAVT